MPINTVLFDLDGTLFDTAADLAGALNAVLYSQGCQALPYSTIRPVASKGTRGLLKLGFGIDDTDPRYASLAQQFLSYYQQNIATHTHLFTGMDDVLNYLDQEKFRWGIVTNKPAYLTHALLEELNFHQRPGCIISGDTLPERKPSPKPLLHACELLSTTPEQCVYVGDAECDIQAGQRANMKTLLARYGYISTEDNPDSWQADAAVQHPLEIMQWLTDLT